MGAYYGEEWVQANVDSWLNSEPVPPAPHDFLPGITTADPVAGSYDSTFGGERLQLQHASFWAKWCGRQCSRSNGC